MVYESLSRETLDLQSSLFQRTMKTQSSKAMEEPKAENLVIKLWRQLATSSRLLVRLFEFMKLVELAIVQVIGNIKDEKTLSTLTFMKSKLRN